MMWLSSDSSIQLRKLFVGGLAYNVTDDTLGNYFSNYGQVVNANVMRDASTGLSRGFGFVVYANIVGAELALASKPHTINGGKADVKRAIPKTQMATLKTPRDFEQKTAPGCKLFISGVYGKANTVDSLRIYFDRYGVVEQVEIITQPHGSVGFVIFEKKESADKVLSDNNGQHMVDGTMIRVTKFPSRQHSPMMLKTSPASWDSGTVEDIFVR